MRTLSWNKITYAKKKKAELERDKKILETENLKLEIIRLESERDNLKELQRDLSELAKPIQDVIKIRLDMLNGLLAKEISNNESYAEPYNKWIETVRNDKKKFMDSTRLAFAASLPNYYGKNYTYTKSKTIAKMDGSHRMVWMHWNLIV